MNKNMQQTPRGQLHLETIYGSGKQYLTKEEKVNASFDMRKIETVSKSAYRDALLKRLYEMIMIRRKRLPVRIRWINSPYG